MPKTTNKAEPAETRKAAGPAATLDPVFTANSPDIARMDLHGMPHRPKSRE